MTFENEYNQILNCIKYEIDTFNEYLKKQFCIKNNKIENLLSNLVLRGGKRIRPALIFLITKAQGAQITEKTVQLAFADEMIHNATLIHDDIIDCSLLRRGQKTLNFEYDSKLAVLGGDYLLSLALKELSSLDNGKIIKIHTDSISNLINGELEQYFETGKIISIDKYIEKSRNKTAELFKAGVLSACILSDRTDCIGQIENFALDFGTAFQINNDLKDIEQDAKNKTFTAPILYFMEEKKFNALNNINIHQIDLNAPEMTAAIQKTHRLINKYSEQAIENISHLEDNQYKRAIINLIKMLNTTK